MQDTSMRIADLFPVSSKMYGCITTGRAVRSGVAR